MKIISLSNNEAGYACAVGTSIKRYYKNNYKTNFFDYLVVSMKSINEILSLEHLNLMNENIDIQVSHENRSIIVWNNFDKLISYHDLKLNFNKEEYIDFLNKYKRRFIRLLNFIYEEDILFFIRYGEITHDELYTFYLNIKKINPTLVFYFIHIDYKEDNHICKEKEYSNYKNYIYINFKLINKDKINQEDDIYYQVLNYNWDFVFNIIDKNYIYIKNL